MSAKSVRLPSEFGWRLVAAPGDGAVAFRAFALDHDSELIGVQRVAGSERCVGIVAVVASSDVEQDPLFLVAYDVPSRRGFRRGADPVAFRNGVGGFGFVSVSAACRLPVDDRHAQPPYLPMSLDYPIIRKPLVAPRDVALLEDVRRDDNLDGLLFGVGEDAISSLVSALWYV